MWVTYSFFYLSKFLELCTKSIVIGVPRKATTIVSVSIEDPEQSELFTYPIKSFDILNPALSVCRMVSTHEHKSSAMIAFQAKQIQLRVGLSKTKAFRVHP